MGDGTEFDGMARLADEMARYGNEREAPPRAVMAMLGDRWTTLILLVLREEALRHADLKRTMESVSHEGAISQRVLTLKLRALERDGFVLRTVSEDVPPKVSYRLTALGLELAERARSMIDWINARSDTIRRCREDYDREQAPDI